MVHQPGEGKTSPKNEGGSEEQMHKAQCTLTIRRGPQAGKQFRIDGTSFTIGRSSTNDIVIEHPDVARHHAIAIQQDEGWVIHDLNSRSGTLVNAEKINCGHPLRDGDLLELGDRVSLDFADAGRPGPTVESAPEGGRMQDPDQAWGLPMIPPLRGMISFRPDGTNWILFGAVGVLATGFLLGLIVLGGVVLSHAAAETQKPPSSEAAFQAPVKDGYPPPEGNFPLAEANDAAPTPTTTSTPPSTRIPCTDDMAYVADVTLSDGSIVYAGALLDKTWRLRNTGTCDWGSGYRFNFVSGDEMGEKVVPVEVHAEPGDEVDVTIPIIAPEGPGPHTGSWQLVNDRGENVGPTVSVSLYTQPAPTATPTPIPTRTPTPTTEPTPGPEIQFWADREAVEAGGHTTLHVRVKDVAAVWLDGDVVLGGREDREVTLCVPTTYTLDVQMKDGTHVYRDVTVDVIGECKPTGNPDLTVEYDLLPPQARVGDPVVISYTVMNQGTSPAEGLLLFFNTGISNTRPITLVRGLNLKSGYGFTASYTYTWPLTGTFQTVLNATLSGKDSDDNTDDNAMSRFIDISQR